MVVIGIIANPNTVPQKIDGLNGCQLTYISMAILFTTSFMHVGPRYRDDGHTA